MIWVLGAIHDGYLSYLECTMAGDEFMRFFVWALMSCTPCINSAQANWLPYTVLEEGPQDLTVIAGETARFSCDLNLAARSDVIWWLFESSRCFIYISRNDLLRMTCGVNMNHFRVDVDKVHNIYTIEIDNVSEDDAGRYICKNESRVLASAELSVLPRGPEPTPKTPSDCADGVCCELSYYPTGLAPMFQMEAQATCRWPWKYNSVDIHVHLYCDGFEIRGSNKVLLADRAIGKLERSQSSGCSNFTCNLEIVGESDVKDSCTIHAKTNNQHAVLIVEPEINFVEEGFNAIFFCHINNAPPTSGSFFWYIVHTHYMSVNSISSQPIASTNGYYGKLELSSVKLEDDFMTVECYFEPDNGGNYSARSNPAVLRVLRRSVSQISCYTNGESSLLECTDNPDDNQQDNFKIWPFSMKEWILLGTTLTLLLVVILLWRKSIRKSSKKPRRRTIEDRTSDSREQESDINNARPAEPDGNYPRRRYEYLAERHYDAPYSLLRNIRRFPRRLRNRVIQRQYLRNARQTQSQITNHDAPGGITYGSTDPSVEQMVRLRDRVISHPYPCGGRPVNTSPRYSSDYDILDATTMDVLHPTPPSPPIDIQQSSSQTNDVPSTTKETQPSTSFSSSVAVRQERSTSKKPKVAPRPLSPKPSLIPPTRIPSISADVDRESNHHIGVEPSYINVGDGSEPLASSPTDRREVNSDGYLLPNQDGTQYQDIC